MKMSDKLEERIAYVAKRIKPGYGLNYARTLYKASAQGFYLNPNEKFDLMLLCLKKAGYEIK